jgi:hypothetical protein
MLSTHLTYFTPSHTPLKLARKGKFCWITFLVIPYPGGKVPWEEERSKFFK